MRAAPFDQQLADIVNIHGGRCLTFEKQIQLWPDTQKTYESAQMYFMPQKNIPWAEYHGQAYNRRVH